MTKTTFLIILLILLIFTITKFLIFGYMFKVFKPKEMTDKEKEAFNREMDGDDEDDDFDDLTWNKDLLYPN